MRTPVTGVIPCPYVAGEPTTIGSDPMPGGCSPGLLVGGEGKRQFTVLGLPVNLTARFESERKALDAPITMGEDFYDRLPTELQAMTIQRENQPIN